MKYTSPSVKTVRMTDVLSQLGPARALLYVPGDSQSGSGSGGSGSSSTSQ